MRNGLKRSLVFIGPSNVGKSFWRKRFKKAGYRCVCVDDEIERKLGPYLKAKGYRGIKDVSKWMGQPHEARHKKNSALYLRYEREVMLEIIARLEAGEMLIVDTTGSVIYTGEDVAERLKSLATVVAFGVPDHVKDKMLRKYFRRPKPVIWGDKTFSRRRNETGRQALVRCYPRLLETRLVRYEAMAHIVLDYDLLRQPGFGVDNFLALSLAA